jgi:hypothetical protein
MVAGLKNFLQWWRRLIAQAGGASEFLCDTCRYDHGGACRRPERPNARRCPDFRSGR